MAKTLFIIDEEFKVTLRENQKKEAIVWDCFYMRFLKDKNFVVTLSDKGFRFGEMDENGKVNQSLAYTKNIKQVFDLIFRMGYDLAVSNPDLPRDKADMHKEALIFNAKRKLEAFKETLKEEASEEYLKTVMEMFIINSGASDILPEDSGYVNDDD